MMQVQTKYSYENTWRTTNEADLLQIIVEEIGDADPKGTLSYIKEAIKTGKTIAVGNCKFKRKDQ